MNRRRVIAILRELLAELEAEDAAGAVGEVTVVNSRGVPVGKAIDRKAIADKVTRALHRGGVYPRGSWRK